jgi:isopenicillin N synthase-like dioxygenase
MYIVGHNVDPAIPHNMLEVARQFFQKSEEEKKKISMHLSGAYRGYQRLGENVTGKKRDWHEGTISICNLNPKSNRSLGRAQRHTPGA